MEIATRSWLLPRRKLKSEHIGRSGFLAKKARSLVTQIAVELNLSHQVAIRINLKLINFLQT